MQCSRKDKHWWGLIIGIFSALEVGRAGTLADHTQARNKICASTFEVCKGRCDVRIDSGGRRLLILRHHVALS